MQTWGKGNVARQTHLTTNRPEYNFFLEQHPVHSSNKKLHQVTALPQPTQPTALHAPTALHWASAVLIAGNFVQKSAQASSGVSSWGCPAQAKQT